ncbi:SDR family NAD(P)-dependent oxidoreductase [Janthinobacterium sp. GB4P2]
MKAFMNFNLRLTNMSQKSVVKVVLTGHTSGIGQALASELLGRGMHVLGIARRTNVDLGRRFTTHLSQVAVDLADSRAVLEWLALDPLRPFVLDATTLILVNNAGMVTPLGGLAMQDPEDISRAVQLNVATPMMISAAFALAAACADRRIMHISSGAGSVAIDGWSVYGGSKAALDHHARTLSMDTAASIRIASVAPGVVDTDMQNQLRSTAAERFPSLPYFTSLKQGGHLASPNAVASKLVDLMLSEEFGQSPVTRLP